MLFFPFLEFLLFVQVYLLNLNVLLLEPINVLILRCQFLSPLIQDGLGLIFIDFHFLPQVIQCLPLPDILNISIRPVHLLLISILLQLLVLPLDFFEVFSQTMIVDLILNQFFLALLNLFLSFFQLSVEVVGILDQFGVFVPFSIKFLGQLDNSLMLEAFLCHLD